MYSNPEWLSRARSGGWSQRVPMVQGQAQPSPGPQAWFRGARDPETNEPVGVAETYTIRFGVSPPNAAAENPPYGATFSCFALIISTVEGNPITRKVSLGYGTALTLTAESVNVAIYDETPSEFIPTIAQEYSVTVQIAPGERASYLTPPTFRGQTDVIDSAPSVATGTITVAAAGNARYPIDPTAGAVSVEVTVIDATDPSLATKVTASATTGGVIAKTWNPQINKGFETLPPETTFVEIANTGANAVLVTVTFGIEG